MAIPLRTNVLHSPTISCSTRLPRFLVWIQLAAVASLLAFAQSAAAGAVAEFHRTLSVSPAEVVRVDIAVPSGDVKILYGRDGQVSISASATGSAETNLDDTFLSSILKVEQNGNQLTIRHASLPPNADEGIKILYRIDVPYRTEVTSKLERGKQNISGILGPVKAVTGKGDINAAYISSGLQAEVGIGDLDLQVIGEQVEVKTESGNISCARIPQGVSAQTGEGDIRLMVVGPSTAAVKKGTGRIDVGGAKGGFVGSTDGGELHIRAVPHGNWELTSESGSIRIELPPVAKFDLDASTKSGKFQIDREDFARPAPDAHRLLQTLDGGGRAIRFQTESGNIVIR
jgi:hypothetical protein